MSNKIPTEHKHSAVVATVFESFVRELQDQKVADTPTIKRIEAALAHGQFSVDKLRTALFSEDPLP